MMMVLKHLDLFVATAFLLVSSRASFSLAQQNAEGDYFMLQAAAGSGGGCIGLRQDGSDELFLKECNANDEFVLFRWDANGRFRSKRNDNQCIQAGRAPAIEGGVLALEARMSMYIKDCKMGRFKDLQQFDSSWQTNGLSGPLLLSSRPDLCVVHYGSRPVVGESRIMLLECAILGGDRSKGWTATREGAVAPSTSNPCAGQRPNLPNVQCVVDAVEQTGEQSGANVTKGYNGAKQTNAIPIRIPYAQAGLCPVNVHWHMGAEHYSLGQYDETGTGPPTRNDFAREGFQCKYYTDSDEKFTKPYQWEHCVGMEVGRTYEVHWPHSAAGACGTPFQYQTPFYDGVFCRDGIISDTAQQIGVQAQVFTIVNDEEFYNPNLFKGMLVGGNRGTDLAIYTGSTTGTSRNNEVCSQFSPITWQVDRKCHMISASSFDKLCKDMKDQADDMSDDLYPHGARGLVADALAANNHNRFLRGA